MGTKDFGAIENDYAFFMAHATEAESDVAVYVSSLAEFTSSQQRIRLLDFGCGTGEFSDRLLSALSLPPEKLQLSLFEPVSHQLQLASQHLSRFSQHPITCLSNVNEVREGSFDLILSNHVLYYVDDLDAVLQTFLNALDSGGRIQTAIAGWDNALLQIWKTGFSMLGKPVPYYAAEDVEDFLNRNHVSYTKLPSPYLLRFPDSEENRWKILRFLFGEHLHALKPEKILLVFDQYIRDGYVEMQTSSDHIVIDPN